MKNIFLIFLCYIIPYFSLGQTEDDISTSYQEIILPKDKPKVKQINTYIYQYENDRLLRSDLVRMSNFDEAGKEINRVFLNGQGGQERKITFEFDSLGRLERKVYLNNKNLGTQFYRYNYVRNFLVRTERMYSLPDSQLKKSMMRKYDKWGRLASEQKFDGDTIPSNRREVQLIDYKKNGKMASQDFLDASGLIYQSFWYDYDEHGKETDFMSLDREGKLLAQRITNYTESGKEELSYLGNEMIPIKVVHSRRDLEGGIKEEEKSFYRREKLYEKEFYRYDSEGRVLLSQKTRISNVYELGTFTERIEYIYNSLGLISEKTFYINAKMQKRYLFLYEYY